MEVPFFSSAAAPSVAAVLTNYGHKGAYYRGVVGSLLVVSGVDGSDGYTDVWRVDGEPKRIARLSRPEALALAKLLEAP